MSASGIPGAPLGYPTPPPPPPFPGNPPPREYASLLSRFLAVLLDLILLAVVAGVALLLLLPLGLLAALSVASGSSPVWLALIVGPFVILLLLLFILYFSYFESSTGQTLGKRALHIRVVEEATGRPPSLGRSVVRNVLRIIDWLPTLFLLGFIVALLTSHKQRLGDLAAGTVVVKE